jgi:hypothetical protein
MLFPSLYFSSLSEYFSPSLLFLVISFDVLSALVGLSISIIHFFIYNVYILAWDALKVSRQQALKFCIHVCVCVKFLVASTWIITRKCECVCSKGMFSCACFNFKMI